MNTERILRATNALLLFTGYHLHWYELKSRRQKPCLWGIINLLVISLFYMLCVNQHFSHSALLKLMQDVSPFLRKLIRLQVLLGITIFCFGLYEMRLVVRAANGLSKLLPCICMRKFSRAEALAYFLLYSTHIIGLGFVLYIAIEMEFELPPLDNIFVSLALFIPHLVVAGALRLYCVGAWLLHEQLQQAKADFDVLLVEQQPATGMLVDDVEIAVVVSATNPCVKVRENDLEKSLLQLHTRLTLLAELHEQFNEALQWQLTLLFMLNNHCLLAGVYSLIYFENSWHVMFTPRWKRIFYAANCSIYVLIFWDYLCLCLSTTLFSSVRTAFRHSVELTLKQRKRFEPEERNVLQDIGDLLAKSLNFNILGVVKLSIWNVLRIHIVVAVVIALIVMYHYLNDEIIAIITRLDSADDDDDE